MIAALFVESSGVYANLAGVDPWDRNRDARRYAGPHPVVAHPPCERWGRYWHGGPSCKNRKKRGDDGGCFEAALASVMRWGGVLEHPEASSAWLAFNIARPPRAGGWVSAGLYQPGWTCCVEQGHSTGIGRERRPGCTWWGRDRRRWSGGPVRGKADLMPDTTPQLSARRPLHVNQKIA